jgi:DNA-binding ferritin-like protein (Dps family)
MATTQESINKLNKYTERLELLNKQLQNVNKSTKEYQRLTSEKNKVEQKAVKAAKELSTAQGKLSSTLKNHKPLIDKANKAQERFNKSQQSGGNATKGFVGKLKTAVGTLARYGLAYKAINTVQRVFTELTIGSVKQSIAFEKSLANLGAVAGATSEEVKQLGKNALEVAGSTKFTAQEIVGLQTELSKLGFSADDVVASTQAIAFASQALGSPLEATASLVGKLRNQFNLLVEQTTMISDVLVTSINESALSFESFGTAMQYVGPIANNLGLSLEQTAGAMAVLADNGFTASRIGTGLRGIFTELGKTSADVEASLNSLAEENLSLGEAVELVGKRNAAQLLTLLKNIDAINEANDTYYQHGRALISAAKQADTFSGQMGILTSNFREFQINLGNALVDSNIFTRALGFLSDKAYETALGFKTLRDIGIEGFQEDIEDIIDNGTSPLTQSLNRMVESGKISKNNLGALSAAFKEAEALSKRFGESITPSQERLEELGVTKEQFAALQGYFRLLENGVKTQKEQTAITNGQARAAKVYGEEVKALIKSSLEGNNVNKEAEQIQKGLEYTIDNLTKSIKTATGERKLELEAEKKAYEALNEQVINTYLNKDELRKIESKKEKEFVEERIKIENEATANLVNSINERAKQQSAVAETAQQRADIEAKRAAAVSEAYKDNAKTIAGLVPIYEENIDLVENAVKANEKLSEVLGSEVINDVSKAFDDYSSELRDLKKAQEEGTISQEGYERAVGELRNRFIQTIETFRVFAGTSQEVNKFLDDMLVNFDALSISVSNSTEKGKKDWEDFTKEFKETAWADIAKEAVDALGESLGAFNDVALENTKNRLAQDMEEVKNRYEIEDEILKSQLNNQLITESQFRKKQKDLRKVQVAEENAIAKELFNAEKKQDRNDAALQGIEAAAQSYLQAFQNYEPVTAAIVGSIGAGIAAANSSAQIAAINSRKYFDKKFADGGVVNGPSHAEGGVPFSVQGRGGYEMEGGEYIINKRATSMHRDLLDKINNTGLSANRNRQTKFALGGIVGAVTGLASVDYLEEIAMNTAMSANNSSKPVRAYVSDKDLKSDSTERKIRDRNDRI